MCGRAVHGGAGNALNLLSQFDADIAESDAESAESDAAAAIDFADWAIENARVSILTAIDARVTAKQKAAAIRA